MQEIDYNELVRNRDWLIGWQQEEWYNKKPEGLCLHLGSGSIKIPGWINVDPYTKESDCKDDMRYLPSFEENTVSKIVSHHAIEHLPMRSIWPMLKRWYSLLKPEGTLEIGAPDFELCAQAFLEASEKERYQRYIWTIYGAQADMDSVSPTGEWSLKDDFPINMSQVHMAGLTLGVFIRLLEDAGFKMLDAKNYDGLGTPSFFVYAYKPELPNITPTVLEMDACIGVFTNKTKYLPRLWESVNKFLPHIQFITRIQRGSIMEGMKLLREDFIKTDKRFQIYIDDDIVILNSGIIKNAIESLVNNKAGICGVYSTFEESALTEPYSPNREGLVTREHKSFSPGYFIGLDTKKVNPEIDIALPDKNTALDTTFNIAVRSQGYPIWISADYVYHQFKNVQANTNVIEVTNQYLMKRWGNFYFANTGYDNCVLDKGWRI